MRGTSLAPAFGAGGPGFGLALALLVFVAAALDAVLDGREGDGVARLLNASAVAVEAIPLLDVEAIGAKEFEQHKKGGFAEALGAREFVGGGLFVELGDALDALGVAIAGED